ncbi:lactonase family protein, partial [Micromonospora aurantiaca]|nr:lactonase family protein [Micromonospora aurantiaca]
MGAVTGQDEIVHIGGYTAETGGRAEGVVAARRDRATGELTPL